MNSSSSHVFRCLPPPRLVNAFGDEVRWESVLELLPVFKGVVGLGVRHAAALKPAVEHLCDPAQLPLTTAGRDGQTIDAGMERNGERTKNKEEPFLRQMAAITI